MIGYLYWLASFATGLLAAYKLEENGFWEKTLHGFVFGTMTGAWLLFLYSLAFGLGWLAFATAGASLFFLSAFFYERKTLAKIRADAGAAAAKSLERHGKFLVLLAGTIALFAILFYTHSLEPKNGGLYSGGSTWGDLALHLTLVNNFLQSAGGLALEYPVYAGQRLGYPFLTDFFTAGLAFQSDLRLSLIASGIVFSACLVALLYLFAKRFGGNGALHGRASATGNRDDAGRERGARIAVLLLLFAGGIGTFRLLADSPDLETAIQNHSHAFLSQHYNVQFTNFVTDFWLPQRNNLVAFCAMLVVLSLLWRNRAAEKRPGELLFAGLVLGMTPLFSFHAAGTAALFFLDWKRLEGEIKSAAWFFGPAIIMAIPQVLWSLPQAAGAVSSLRLQPGWMAGPEGVAAFLFNNFGVLLFLAAFAFLEAEKDQKKFYAGFAAIFVAANVFVFQPWDYDNAKFFFVWLVPTTALAGSFLGKHFEKGNAKKAAAIALALLVCIPGFFFVAREAGLSWQLYSAGDVAFAEWAKANTPAEAVFLTADGHNHPVPSLAGRTVVLGYKGWLWSHGINYAQREKDVNEMFRGGPEAKRLMGHYNVSYAVIGPGERALGADEDFFRQNFEKAYDENGFQVFRAG